MEMTAHCLPIGSIGGLVGDMMRLSRVPIMVPSSLSYLDGSGGAGDLNEIDVSLLLFQLLVRCPTPFVAFEANPFR